MDKTTEKLIAMVAGQNRNQFDENSISLDVRAKIDTALDSVFQGKSLLIWCSGGKLGNAWETAMEDLINQIFAIKNTATIVEYLRIAVFALRDRWKVKILQSGERNSVAIAPEQELTDLRNYANSLIESGMGVINALLNTIATTGCVRQPQNVMNLNMARGQIHEYECVRKRA